MQVKRVADKKNKLIQLYKRFQSQGHVKQNLTEHAFTQRAKGGYPVQAEQPRSVQVLPLCLVSEIIKLFMVKRSATLNEGQGEYN